MRRANSRCTLDVYAQPRMDEREAQDRASKLSLTEEPSEILLRSGLDERLENIQ